MSDSNQVSLKRKASDPEESPSAASVPKLEKKLTEKEFPSHFGRSFEKIKKFKERDEFTDFVIKTGDEDIPVHKMILAASSEYFETMLSCDLKEKKEGFMEIKEVDPMAVKTCIDFIYTGKASFSSSCEFAEKLIHASELFRLTELTDLYFEFLKEEVSVESCLQYIELAEKYSKRLFTSFFQNFSHKNFDEVIHCDAFLSLTKDVLQDLLSNIPTSDPDLEILKWEGIKLWIHENEEDREQYILDLLKYISVDRLRVCQLKEINDRSMVQQSQEFKNLLLEAFSTVSSSSHHPDFKKDATHIVVCNTSSRLVLAMNINTKEWSRCAKVPDGLELECIDMVCVKMSIYLTTANSIYRLQNGKFSVICKFNDARTSDTESDDVGVSVASPVMYNTSRVSVYNTGWPAEVRQTIGSSSKYHQSIVHGEVIYIITLNRIVKFNTRTGRYTFMDERLPFHSEFLVAASNTHVYAVAQERGTGIACVMSFTDEVWESISCIENSSTLKEVFWHNSEVYVINRNGLVYYDYEADMWWLKEDNYTLNWDNYKALSIQQDIYLVDKVSGILKLQKGRIIQIVTRRGLNPRLACAIQLNH